MSEKKITSNNTLRKQLKVGSSPIHGRGLFARNDIKKGTYIGTYHGPDTDDNGTYVLWVKEGRKWCGCDGKNILRYLNHSKKPNAEFDGRDLFALKKIREGDEITFDYGEDPSQ